MNTGMSSEPQDTQILLRPEVSAFVEEVRRLLADLDEETRDELTGGLEADLSDQLADGAPLGDPVAYAAELRAAAGLPERRRRAVRRFPAGTPRRAGELLDRSRAAFLARVAHPRVRPAWELVVALRPAWWVARAWILLTLADVATGYSEPISLVPSFGVPFLGWALLVSAVVVSTLAGTGRLWPGTRDRGTSGRVLVLAVNGLAVLAPFSFGLPNPTYLTYGYDEWIGYSAGYDDAQREIARDGSLRVGSRVIHNVFAYDAQGRPLRQVQLVDENGEPIAVGPNASVRGHGDERVAGCPAFNGRTPVYHVYPLAEARVRRGTCAPEDAADAVPPQHPLASLPPVTRLPQDGVQQREPAERPLGTDR